MYSVKMGMVKIRVFLVDDIDKDHDNNNDKDIDNGNDNNNIY